MSSAFFGAKYHEAKPKNMTYNTGITVNGVKLTVVGFHELKETLSSDLFVSTGDVVKRFKTQHDRNKGNVPGFAGVLCLHYFNSAKSKYQEVTNRFTKPLGFKSFRAF